MKSARIIFCSVLAVTVGACAGPVVEPALSASPDRSSFDGRAERVIVKIRAWEAGETPGGGVVHLTAPVGHFVDGDDVILSEGFVTATYACSPVDEAACLGPIRLSAEWAGVRATTQVIGVEQKVPEIVRWEVVPTGTTAKLLALAASKDGTAWAVGEHGVVLHLTGRTWTKVPTGVGSTLRAVTMGDEGHPVVVGDDGVLLQWKAAQFSLSLHEGEDFTAVAVDGRGLIHLGAASGVIYE